MSSFIAFQPNSGTGVLTADSTPSPAKSTNPMNDFSFVSNSIRSPPADLPSHFDHNFHNFQFQNNWPGVDANIVSTLPESPTKTSALKSSGSTLSLQLEPAFQTPVHDCEAKALTMLHSLRFRPTEHPNLGGQVSQPTPPLDKILHANRVAISTLGDLLQCDCAQQPHLALLYMATISKTLFWYRIALNLSFKTSTTYSELRNEPYSPPSQTEAHSMSPVSNTFLSTIDSRSKINGRARANTIQIGVFDLEEEDEAILVRSVVMTEVKKVGRLIDLMKGGRMQMDSKEGSIDQESPSVASWYRAGGEKLEREVQDTLREARGASRITTNYEWHTGRNEQTWSA